MRTGRAGVNVTASQRAECLARLADALAIGGVGLGAVVDVPLDGLRQGAFDRPRGVVEQALPLLGTEQPEQVAGLGEVVVVLAVVEVIRRRPDGLGRVGVAGLVGPAAEVVEEKFRPSGSW